MIKIIIFVGLVGFYMNSARCSPLASPQSDLDTLGDFVPVNKITANDPMKVMDAPLKSIVHEGGNIH